MKQITKLLTLGVGLASTFNMIHAAGTEAGLTITNTVTVDFDVAGIDQADLPATADFTVDRKILFTLTQVGGVTSVTPNQQDQVQEYTLVHFGNDDQDFKLTLTQPAGDDFDVTGVQIYQEDTVSNVAGFDPTDDLLPISGPNSYVDELTEGAVSTSVTIYVVADIPNTAGDGDISTIQLLATAAVAGTASTMGADEVQTAGVDNEDGAADVVFADGDGDGGGATDVVRDGKYYADNDYDVTSAALTVTKTSTVVWDPINCTGSAPAGDTSANSLNGVKDATCGANEPKRINGAVVHYRITLDNSAGTSAADAVDISDPLDTRTTHITGSMFYDGVAEDENNIGGDDTDGTLVEYAADQIDALIASIAGGATDVLVYRVLIE